jgi:hypothetical protein
MRFAVKFERVSGPQTVAWPELQPAIPNPFHGSATLAFSLARGGLGRL